MSSQPHLQRINNSQAPLKADFSLFPSLPKELHLEIWLHTLQCRRIMRLRIRKQRGQAAKQAGENTESIRNGERYFIVVDGNQLLSKLLRVNKESREEALLHYRVHLHCRFTAGATGHGTLYLNPEWDCLYLSAEWPAKDTLVDFLYRLKTIYDPRHFGLINLAVDGTGLNGNDLYGLQSSDLDPEARLAFVESHTTTRGLVRLESASWTSDPRCIERTRNFRDYVQPLFPILTMVPTFEQLHRDPRPIAQDLKSITGLTGSGDVVQLWLQILKK